MNSKQKSEKFNLLKSKIKTRYPDTHIKYKDKSIFWKLMPKPFRITGFTFRNTIWLPTNSFNVATLAHEYAHLHRMKKMGFVKFLIEYLFPQVVSIPLIVLAVCLAVFGLIDLALYAGALSLIVLFPWPAPKRLDLELEGYLMNLAIERWANENNSTFLKKFIVDSLLSWTYYKMSWNKKMISRVVGGMADKTRLKPQDFPKNVVYKDTYEAFHETT